MYNDDNNTLVAMIITAYNNKSQRE